MYSGLLDQIVGLFSTIIIFTVFFQSYSPPPLNQLLSEPEKDSVKHAHDLGHQCYVDLMHSGNGQL